MLISFIRTKFKVFGYVLMYKCEWLSDFSNCCSFTTFHNATLIIQRIKVVLKGVIASPYCLVWPDWSVCLWNRLQDSRLSRAPHDHVGTAVARLLNLLQILAPKHYSEIIVLILQYYCNIMQRGREREREIHKCFIFKWYPCSLSLGVVHHFPAQP